MLQDDIILDLNPEIDIVVNENLLEDIILEPDLDASILVNEYSNFVVTIDLDSMESEQENPFSRFGKVQQTLFFFRSVLGTKKTFAQVSFDIRNTIQTIGTATINSANHNLVQRIFTFGRMISAQRTTFGQASFAITNNIQTAGTNAIGGIRFYGSGRYGDGPYGTYHDEGILLPIRFTSTISGNIPYKQTAIGEISLASHGTPIIDTNHSIKVRARTLSGSTGVLRVALYEGSNNRSGDLQTPVLTNSLTDYSLDIPENLAATITDYSNLSIKFWGYDLSGHALVFEIAKISLELPIATGGISYGIVSRQFTFGKSVSGAVTSKTTSRAEISLGSHGIPSERTNHTIKVRARTLSGSTGVLKAALYEGSNNRSGDLISQPLTNTLADYTLVILDSLAATIIDYSNLSIKFWGFDIAGNALVFEVAKISLELPTSTGNTTQYGVVSRGFTFTKAVSGSVTSNTKYGAVARGFTFTKAVSGIISNKKTAVAEISLASHGTPSVRTNHTIKVRARTTSGSTGVIRAALYETSNNRSGDLTSSLLTNSLADYSLAIPDAAAATITDYSNLHIKFWGHDSAGNALVFEVARLYLELPAP